MSYDPIQAMRQHAQNTRDEASRGQVAEGRWDFFRITNEPLWCRLIAGSHEVTTYEEGRQRKTTQPFFVFWEHYLQPKGDLGHQFLACRRYGNEYRPAEECPVCRCIPESDPRPMYAYTLLGLGYYHAVQQPSRKNPQRLYTRHYACESRPENPNCQYCRMGAPIVAGHLGHAKVGSRRDFESIMQADAEAASYCACGGRVHPYQLACPRCHTVLHSLDTSGLSDREFRSYAQESFCSTCGVPVVPMKDVRCTQCKTPNPFNIFQADLLLSYPQEASGRGTLRVQIVGMGALADEYANTKITALDLPAIYAPKAESTLMKIVRKYPGSLAPAVDPSAGGQFRTPGAVMGAPMRPPTALVPPPALRPPSAPAAPPVSAPPLARPPAAQSQAAPAGVPAHPPLHPPPSSTGPLVDPAAVLRRPAPPVEGAPPLAEPPQAPMPGSFYPPRLHPPPGAQGAYQASADSDAPHDRDSPPNEDEEDETQ